MGPSTVKHGDVTLSGRELARLRRQAMATAGKTASRASAQSLLAQAQSVNRMGLGGVVLAAAHTNPSPQIELPRADAASNCACTGAAGGCGCNNAASAEVVSATPAPQRNPYAAPTGRTLARARRQALAAVGKPGIQRVANATRIATSMPGRADCRLQGLLPFVLRTAPAPVVWVKAYAGALFDVEHDVADWTQRELERLTGAIEGGERLDYLKVAAYHYSSSAPCDQGCAAHGGHDAAAVAAAIERLHALQVAVDNTYGHGAAPQVLLLGVDTDCDAIRIHLPDASGQLRAERYLDSAALYRATLGLSAAAVQQALEAAERAIAAINLNAAPLGED